VVEKKDRNELEYFRILFCPGNYPVNFPVYAVGRLNQDIWKESLKSCLQNRCSQQPFISDIGIVEEMIPVIRVSHGPPHRVGIPGSFGNFKLRDLHGKHGPDEQWKQVVFIFIYHFPQVALHCIFLHFLQSGKDLKGIRILSVWLKPLVYPRSFSLHFNPIPLVDNKRFVFAWTGEV